MIGLSRRSVQVCLGVLWLIDGALQLQHQMFSSNFATQVIKPALEGQPGFVSGPMNFGIHLFLHSPVVFDSLFALVQLSLGLLILRPKTTKLGLYLSIPWALIVWIFGEGYGGIFSGHTLLLMGAPGAVIIYGILAIASLPKESNSKRRQPVAYWLALVWAFIWIGGAVYQLLPGQNSTTDVSSMISANAQGAPHWLASIDNKVSKDILKISGTPNAQTANTLTAQGMNMTNAQMTHMANEPTVSTPGSGYTFILILALVQLVIGIGALLPKLWRQVAISLGMLMSLIFWVVGQSLGGYYTGLATDPNSGPLLVITGLAILGTTNLDLSLSRLGHRLERLLIGRSSAHRTKVIKPSTNSA